MEIPDFGDLHVLSVAPSGPGVMLGGFEGYKKDRWFCLKADGSRYHDYGISTGSTLICSPDVPVKQGDLVVAGEGKDYAVYIFNTDPDYLPCGNVRVTRDVTSVKAVVLASLNFFQ